MGKLIARDGRDVRARAVIMMATESFLSNIIYTQHQITMKPETPLKLESEAPPSAEPSGPGTPINISTTLTPSIIRVGCKCFVEKDGEKRLAEILGTRMRKGALEFYVHYQEFNKVFIFSCGI